MSVTHADIFSGMRFDSGPDTVKGTFIVGDTRTDGHIQISWQMDGRTDVQGGGYYQPDVRLVVRVIDQQHIIDELPV